MRSLILMAAIAAAGCGVKPELPDQTPYTGGITEGDYFCEYRWDVNGVTDMIVGRDSGIFYVIQHEDSLGIYPAYRRADTALEGRQLFTGLERPLLLADGRDFDRRIWVYDGADRTIKGYDGNEFLNELEVLMEISDPAWQSIVAIAADDESRVFVADRGPNRIYRYRVIGGAEDFEILADGQISWTSQGGGATVRDLAFAAGRLLLLDDVLLTLQILDPDGGPLDPPVFTYLNGFIDAPELITGDGETIFVSDRIKKKVWAIDSSLQLDEAVGMNWFLEAGGGGSPDTLFLLDPVALTVNEGKLYVADPELGKILDYEKR